MTLVAFGGPSQLRGRHTSKHPVFLAGLHPGRLGDETLRVPPVGLQGPVR